VTEEKLSAGVGPSELQTDDSASWGAYAFTCRLVNDGVRRSFSKAKRDLNALPFPLRRQDTRSQPTINEERKSRNTYLA